VTKITVIARRSCYYFLNHVALQTLPLADGARWQEVGGADSFG
jgi:hypothetical protein